MGMMQQLEKGIMERINIIQQQQVAVPLQTSDPKKSIVQSEEDISKTKVKVDDTDNVHGNHNDINNISTSTSDDNDAIIESNSTACNDGFKNPTTTTTKTKRTTGTDAMAAESSALLTRQTANSNTISKKPKNEIPNLDATPANVLNKYCELAHLISSTGVYDELMALVKMGIVEIIRPFGDDNDHHDNRGDGIPILTKDWYKNVDFVILDDMDKGWSSEQDPYRFSLVPEGLRNVIEKWWIKSHHGWRMKDDEEDDDDDEVIFDFQAIEEWKQAFTGQQEQQARYDEGVGQFGF